MKPTRHDLILVAAILLAALLVGGLLFGLIPRGLVATVTLDGEEIARLPLDTNTTFTVDTGHIIVIRDGEVLVESAPCPDQICVQHFPVSREGETLVCLPYRLVVTVGSAAKGGQP